jgi:hypothetical protein
MIVPSLQRQPSQRGITGMSTAVWRAETWESRNGRAALTVAGSRVTNLPWDSRLAQGWALCVPVVSVITMMLLLAPSPIGVTGLAGAKEAVTL